MTEDVAPPAYRAPGQGGRLVTLDTLTVASPCSVSWNAMQGNGRVRHCGQCDKQVFNIDAMTRADAEALLAERGEGACVRFYRRFDGTILTADCPVGVRARVKVRALWAAAVTVMLGILSFLGLATLSSPVHGATAGAVCPPGAGPNDNSPR
jgi:hypothetical protein